MTVRGGHLARELITFVRRLQIKNRLVRRAGSYRYFGPKRLNPVYIAHIQKMTESGMLQSFDMARLLGRQYRGNRFQRFDVIVRLLAAEEMLGRSRGGIALYERMQRARSAQFGAACETGTLKDFRELVESVSLEGFRAESTIVLDDAGCLVDGAHRLALAVLGRERHIAVEYIPRHFGVDYGLDWFAANNFSEDECTQLQDTFDGVARHYGLFLPAILWPPVGEYFDEIVDYIGLNHRIVSVEDFDMGDGFEEFVRQLYEIDDTSPANIRIKLESMRSHSARVRIVLFELGNPAYRRKIPHQSDISTIVEKLKRRCRREFGRRIPDYVYDNVVHVPDNYDHALEVFALLKPPVENQRAVR